MSSALLTCISLWKTTGLINGVGWNWPAFQTFLPSHIIERIKAVMIHDDADLEDSWFWNLTADGEFSVHTAYNYLVSSFLLILGNVNGDKFGVLISQVVFDLDFGLSNTKNSCAMLKEREWGFTSIDLCIICSGGTEDVDHFFRSCSAASLLWAAFLCPHQEVQRQKRMMFEEWFTYNLNTTIDINGLHNWQIAFPTILWCMWMWRNAQIFSGEHLSLEVKIRCIRLRLVNEFQQVFTKRQSVENLLLTCSV